MNKLLLMILFTVLSHTAFAQADSTYKNDTSAVKQYHSKRNKEGGKEPPKDTTAQKDKINRKVDKGDSIPLPR